MNALFWVKCSAALAEALGAKPRKRLDRPYRFPVYEECRTHHADMHTEKGLYAWLWQLDKDHPTIEVL